MLPKLKIGPEKCEQILFFRHKVTFYNRYLRIILRPFFSSIFGWGDPSQLESWSEGCFKHLKLSRGHITKSIIFQSSNQNFIGPHINSNFRITSWRKKMKTKPNQYVYSKDNYFLKLCFLSPPIRHLVQFPGFEVCDCSSRILRFKPK